MDDRVRGGDDDVLTSVPGGGHIGEFQGGRLVPRWG